MAYPTLETSIGPLVIQKRSLQVGERIRIEPYYQPGQNETLFIEVYRAGRCGWVHVEGEKEQRHDIGLVPKTIDVTKGIHIIGQRIITE